MTNQEEIKIVAEPNLDPQFCKIRLVNRTFLPGQHYNCTNKDQAQGSPMLEALFELDSIEKVLVSENTLNIQKSGPEPWPVLGKKVGAVIRTAFNSDEPLFSDELLEKIKGSQPESSSSTPDMSEELDLDDAKTKEVYDLIQNQINPAVASHGGKIDLVKVEENKIYVRMMGGCQGCGMANVTLKQGIETMIRQNLPEIEEVVDVTNHAAGTNPYFQSSKK